MRTRSMAGASALLLLMSSSSLAQSLGESAKKAEEQRKTVAGKSIRIEAVQSPALELKAIRLDKPTVEHYVDARVAMARLWHRDLKLYERVRAAMGSARTLDELCRALDSEPQVKEVFALYNYSAEEFLATELSISQAQRLTEGGFEMSSLSAEERANYDFAGRHMVWLSLMRGRMHKAEAGLSLWR
jgi:hypothetical protein